MVVGTLPAGQSGCGGFTGGFSCFSCQRGGGGVTSLAGVAGMQCTPFGSAWAAVADKDCKAHRKKGGQSCYDVA